MSRMTKVLETLDIGLDSSLLITLILSLVGRERMVHNAVQAIRQKKAGVFGIGYADEEIEALLMSHLNTYQLNVMIEFLASGVLSERERHAFRLVLVGLPLPVKVEGDKIVLPADEFTPEDRRIGILRRVVQVIDHSPTHEDARQKLKLMGFIPDETIFQKLLELLEVEFCKWCGVNRLDQIDLCLFETAVGVGSIDFLIPLAKHVAPTERFPKGLLAGMRKLFNEDKGQLRSGAPAPKRFFKR